VVKAATGGPRRVPARLIPSAELTDRVRPRILTAGEQG
jgi:hypothetical protein